MDVPSEGSIDRLDRGVSLWEFAQEIGVAESFHIRERDVDGMAPGRPGVFRRLHFHVSELESNACRRNVHLDVRTFTGSYPLLPA